MLSDEDKDYLVERLIYFVAGVEKPRETLAAPFLDTTLLQDFGSGTPQFLVQEIVRLCLADRWDNDPPSLVRLIEIMPVDLTDTKLAAMRDRVRVKPPPGPDHLKATILDNGTPFVDRTALRDHLRRLATAAARTKPILVVSGSSKSGKSYSTEYIDHFSYHQPPPTTTYRLALRPGTELETGPEEVAVDLVAMMGRTLEHKPKPHTNQKLLAEQLASWVLNEAVQTPTRSWLVLDNFQGDKLRPETRDLVIALADRVTTGVFPDRCRLILIGFDASVLAVDPGRVGEEHIGAIPTAELEACVREIAARAPVPLAAGTLLAFVTNALPNGEQRMKEMNTRLRALILAVDQIAKINQGLPGLDFADVLAEMLADLPFGDGLLPELKKRLEALRASASEIVP